MTMPTLSPAEPAATRLPPLDLAPRRLADDVFQSAEEAVRVEGQADSFADALPSAAAPDVARQGGGRAFSFTKAIRSHVAAKPCQSALLAAAAGALAALVLRSQLRGGFPSLRPPWLPSIAPRRPRR
jgi:hypothetical protein